MMDAASCRLCSVLLWLVRYAALELNSSSTTPCVDVTKEQKSACIGAYRTAYVYVYSMTGTEKCTASNTAHCSGQWNVVAYTVALCAKVLCTCKVEFLFLVTFQTKKTRPKWCHCNVLHHTLQNVPLALKIHWWQCSAILWSFIHPFCSRSVVF